MGSKPVADDVVAMALWPAARRATLGLLYTRPDEAFFLREIVVRTGLGFGHVQRELARLSKAGILSRRRAGVHVYFQANRDCPVFSEILGLVRKTVGLAAGLRKALAPLADRIDVAVLYGSVARGEETAASDVDVLVIGSASFAEVVAALRPVEREARRQVNSTVFPLEEARGRIEAGRHFLTAVLESPLVILVGDEHVLAGLRAKRVDSATRVDA